MFKKWLRKKFCENEVPKGELLILWRDVDNEVSGWNSKADREEIVLFKVSNYITEKKREKLEYITGIKKGEEESYDSPPPCTS